jgi:hypothetical protein
MKLKPIASNMTELKLDSPDHITILFSYETPVAAFGLSPAWHEKHGSAYIKTEQKFSVTTSRHINKWLDGATAKTVPQAILETLID